MNVTKKAPTGITANQNNKENQLGTSGCGAGGGGGGEEHEILGEPYVGHNAENHDARQTRKNTKKKKQVDVFQERPLKDIEAPQPQLEILPKSP